MKEKKLSFPFISFSESGLFSGLRPIQIKKSFSLSHWPKSHKPHAHACAGAPPGFDPAIGHIYSTDSDYRKDIAAGFLFPF
jgi:hypothetical protein